MFTGLVTDVGEVVSRKDGGDTRFVIRTSYDLGSVALGASIACSGVCLTAVSFNGDTFAVDASGETLGVTTLKSWQPGTQVNLERSLKLGDEMGGHIVTGHVDTMGEIVTLRQVGDSWFVQIAVPADYGVYIAKKGSIAVNGVSLTVNEVADQAGSTIFDLNIIPHTWDVTAFNTAMIGDAVNIEVDLMARYMARFAERNA